MQFWYVYLFLFRIFALLNLDFSEFLVACMIAIKILILILVSMPITSRIICISSPDYTLFVKSDE